MADKKQELIAGKYKTQEELINAHKELEAKLGAQGREVEAVRKQAQQLNQLQEQVAAYQTWAGKVSPIVEYWNANKAGIEQYHHAMSTGDQPMSTGNQQKYAQAQPAQYQQRPTVADSILTNDERAAIAQEAAEFARRQTLQDMNSWTQQFGNTAQEWVDKRISDATNQNQQSLNAFQQTLYKGLERALPKEQIAAMQQHHATSLKYADPTKIDPMQMAGEFLDMQNKLSTIEAERDAAIKDREELQRRDATVSGVGGLAGYSLNDNKDNSPATEGEILQQVEQAVADKHGPEALKELYR